MADVIAIVVDGISTFVWDDVTPNTADGTATCMTAGVFVVADGMATFVEHLKDVRLRQRECIISYDVTALFTSVPIQPVLNIIQQRLAKERDLQKRTSMTIKQIISLLEFCLSSTSFVFQGQYYQQMERVAMGSSLSPIVANIFMEKFEKRPWKQHHIPKSVEKICR